MRSIFEKETGRRGATEGADSGRRGATPNDHDPESEKERKPERVRRGAAVILTVEIGNALPDKGKLDHPINLASR
jgi:hypothetical protein